jgi:hypothetical protein
VKGDYLVRREEIIASGEITARWLGRLSRDSKEDYLEQGDYVDRVEEIIAVGERRLS